MVLIFAEHMTYSMLQLKVALDLSERELSICWSCTNLTASMYTSLWNIW